MNICHRHLQGLSVTFTQVTLTANAHLHFSFLVMYSTSVFLILFLICIVQSLNKIVMIKAEDFCLEDTFPVPVNVL